MTWPSRFPGWRQAIRYSRLNRLRALLHEEKGHTAHPPNHGYVLEIGAGQAPVKRTDVVVDKYPFDNHERPADAPISFAKPLIVADGEHLPFADRAFTFVICIHVLEHALDPEQFGRELRRVSPAGFAQVPTRLAELTFGWPYHPWLIDIVANMLVFEPKDGREAPMSGTFHEIYRTDELFRMWFASRRSLWHQSVTWQGALPIKVKGTAGKSSSAQVDVPLIVGKLQALSSSAVLQQLPDGVRNALRCPLCLGQLSNETRHLVCGGCGASYPSPGGIPVLLQEAAK